MANRFNESFPSFIPLHSEFSPGLRIIDNFSDHISFNVHNKGKASLLFLLPPSCMVVPIGKFANKSSFSSHFNQSNTASNIYNSLPPMSNRIDLGIDIQQGVPLTTNSEERGRNPSPSAKSSRESSLASSGCSTPYHERMEIDVTPGTEKSNIESRELSYETEQEKEIRVSMAANQQVNQQAPMRPTGGINKASLTHGQHEENVFNV